MTRFEDLEAKYMFEDLGFAQVGGYTGIMYVKRTTETFDMLGTIGKTIWVHFVNNTVTVSKSLFMGGGTDEAIDMRLLKAINKQWEELGWWENEK